MAKCCQQLGCFWAAFPKASFVEWRHWRAPEGRHFVTALRKSFRGNRPRIDCSWTAAPVSLGHN
jgi:hypothetical protein